MKTQKIFFFKLILLLVIGNLNAQQNANCNPRNAGKQIEIPNNHWNIIKTGYLQYLPKNFSTDPDNKNALILNFSDSNLSGNGVNTLKKLYNSEKSIGTLSYLLQKNNDNSVENDLHISAVVISPQKHDNYFSTEMVLDIYNRILEPRSGYNIDPKKIYLVGIGSGADAIWKFAAKHSDKIRAIVPISPKIGLKNLTAEEKSNLKQLPTWGFANKSGDNGNYKLVDTFREITGENYESEYPGGSFMVDIDVNITLGYTNCFKTPRKSSWFSYQNVEFPVDNLASSIYASNGKDAWSATFQNPKFWLWLTGRVPTTIEGGQGLSKMIYDKEKYVSPISDPRLAYEKVPNINPIPVGLYSYIRLKDFFTVNKVLDYDRLNQQLLSNIRKRTGECGFINAIAVRVEWDDIITIEDNPQKAPCTKNVKVDWSAVEKMINGINGLTQGNGKNPNIPIYLKFYPKKFTSGFCDDDNTLPKYAVRNIQFVDVENNGVYKFRYIKRGKNSYTPVNTDKGYINFLKRTVRKLNDFLSTSNAANSIVMLNFIGPSIDSNTMRVPRDLATKECLDKINCDKAISIGRLPFNPWTRDGHVEAFKQMAEFISTDSNASSIRERYIVFNYTNANFIKYPVNNSCNTGKKFVCPYVKISHQDTIVNILSSHLKDKLLTKTESLCVNFGNRNTIHDHTIDTTSYKPKFSKVNIVKKGTEKESFRKRLEDVDSNAFSYGKIANNVLSHGWEIYRHFDFNFEVPKYYAELYKDTNKNSIEVCNSSSPVLPVNKDCSDCTQNTGVPLPKCYISNSKFIPRGVGTATMYPLNEMLENTAYVDPEKKQKHQGTLFVELKKISPIVNPYVIPQLNNTKNKIGEWFSEYNWSIKQDVFNALVESQESTENKNDKFEFEIINSSEEEEMLSKSHINKKELISELIVFDFYGNRIYDAKNIEITNGMYWKVLKQKKKGIYLFKIRIDNKWRYKKYYIND